MIINLIGNALLTTILCFSARNINILNGYQKFYLILAIIIFLIICIIYLLKLISLIYTKIKQKFDISIKVKKILKWSWIISNGICYLIMLIGFIYDIIFILIGKISNAVYPIIYFIICFIYFIFSIFDYNFIEIIDKLIREQPQPNIRSKPNSDNIDKNAHETSRLKQL